MKIKIASSLSLILILCSCGKTASKQETIYPHDGTWKYQTLTCNGVPFVVTGISEYLTLSGSTGSDLTFGSACYQTTSNLSVSQSGNSLSVSGSSTLCSPNQCSLPWSVSANGQIATEVYPCSTTWGTSTYTVSADTLTQSQTIGSVTCTQTFSRVTEAAPTAPCLTSTYTSQTTTSIIGISGGGDRAAQQFQVSSTQSLVAVQVMMTSDDISYAHIDLYSGGATPDTGSLIASVTKTDVLGFSTSTLSAFEFSSPVTLSPGTTYYIVFTANGTQFLIDVNSSNVITDGQAWIWNGSAWSPVSGSDMSIGFVYKSSGC